MNAIVSLGSAGPEAVDPTAGGSLVPAFHISPDGVFENPEQPFGRRRSGLPPYPDVQGEWRGLLAHLLWE